MEVILGSKNLVVDISYALDVGGREHLVVVAKGTWQIPAAGQRPRPLPPQALEQADVFVGDPADSAILYGADTPRFKPRCDVLFNANAHAPDGVPVKELAVVWQVGPLRKGLKAHGKRHWKKRLGLVSLSDAEPFLRMPLHFGMAFGGSRIYKKGWGGNARVLTEAQLANPAGIGWYGAHADEDVDGLPAPCLEALNEPVRKPDGKQKPVAFSAIARHWQPRPGFAGTYDEQWQRDVFPFLPEDFDEQFNQCAPADQQMEYPTGGEQVILRNMMAGRPDVRFKLPRLDNVSVRILRTDYTGDELLAPADTVYFEPDAGRFSVVWRASFPVRRRIQEFATVAVGPLSAAFWEQKALGEGCAGCGGAAAESAQPAEAA
ncbi:MULTISPECIES: DUF2169 family type VI secretion system accessory protein [Massilia]|uniref:DUF2169 domain-containing protein n=1 Tax=Massilia frigida TaxID=2609281 RepID=A0ABX0N568_9BURK|nr:DUF2169 domain-containing protein [Massilia sp. CCM 9029]MDQ1833213.1 DUF2169 domain-containing protein [Massilia sp. CCM 9029]NHZ80507.1 DUF2169 domain-containing protein [Massilia frigida]